MREVAQDEVIAGVVGAVVDVDPGAGIGLEQEVAERAERALRDLVERRDLDVGRAPADAGGAALLEVARGERLAAHLTGDVAAARHDQRFASHRQVLLP